MRKSRYTQMNKLISDRQTMVEFYFCIATATEPNEMVRQWNKKKSEIGCFGNYISIGNATKCPATKI